MNHIMSLLSNGDESSAEDDRQVMNLHNTKQGLLTQRVFILYVANLKL